MLEGYPTLSELINQIDSYLQRKHPSFFGDDASHPILPIKRSKVIHDNLWGTNSFSWWELVLIDSPIIQRLRDIHQVGLAYQIYPSVHHTRFEHCLGVVTIASRIFDALIHRNRGYIQDIVQAITPNDDLDKTIPRLKQELRLAALLHDTGHSLFSHSSEHVYQSLDNLKAASSELTRFVGKEKGAGEVISFCIALSKSVKKLLERAKSNLIGDTSSDDFNGDINMIHVALMIVGRGSHPFLQFLGDIISSGFDADKLDYLLRDAIAAGLPLRYDLDRYLYSVRLDKGILVDDEGELEKLYDSIKTEKIDRIPANAHFRYPYYETYRLRFPREAMNTIEQIVICKLMLFSYIYHHRKVRAAEGMLVKILQRMVKLWKSKGETCIQILEHFLDMTDSSLTQNLLADNNYDFIREYSYRLINRLLPREVYRLGGALASHAERPLLADFLTSLQDKERRANIVAELEKEIGKELLTNNTNLGTTPDEALMKAGVWVDVPKPPKFEDVDELVIGGVYDNVQIQLTRVFPIGEWTQAYTHFRYYVRIFAFSEYLDQTLLAGKTAMKKIIKINSESFYDKVKRTRG